MKHVLKILYGIIAILSVMILVTVFSFIRRNSSGQKQGVISGVTKAAVQDADSEASSIDSTLRDVSASSASEAESAAGVSSDNAASSTLSVSANASASANAPSSVSANAQNSVSGNQAAQPTAEAENTQNIITTDQTVVLDTEMGKMQYFNQQDSHWGTYLINGKDLMSTNGCGPTCVAMVIHAFGTNGGQVTPVTMADWAVANHQYVVNAGSQHTIVETALPAYGLTVTSLQNSISKETILSELHQHHLLIGLMGPGYFTEEGHYLLMTGIDGDGNICIADPHSSENTSKAFSADFLIGQLRKDAKDGGAPLWSISAGNS